MSKATTKKQRDPKIARLLDELGEAVSGAEVPGEAALYVLGWAVGVADKHGVRLSGLASVPTLLAHLSDLAEAWKAGRE